MIFCNVKKFHYCEKFRPMSVCADFLQMPYVFFSKSLASALCTFLFVYLLFFFLFVCSLSFILASGCTCQRCPRRQSLRGTVLGYRKKLLRASPGSLTYALYSTVTRDLGLKSHPKDN